jgi:NADPH-dependent 2,4-dienoyl-CoA reductase/sulfur reductase-like enzyme
VGGGVAAGYAAKQLVSIGIQPGELVILSADTVPPYDRPPLSKEFLAGKQTEEKVFINPPDFYQEHGIDLRLETTVQALDVNKRSLDLGSRGAIGFERLVLASGAEPRPLPVEGAGVEDVLYLRTLDQSKAIKAATKSATSVVLIGGGFVGMEVASVLAAKERPTTMIFPEDHVWSRLFTPEISNFFEEYYKKRGVDVVA